MTDDNELSADEAAYFQNGGVVPEKPVTPPAGDDTGEDADFDLANEQDDGDKPDKPVKTVPHQALHAERRKRQEAEKNLQDAREKFARLEERTNLIQQAFQTRAQEQQERQPAPKLEDDPLAFIRSEADRLAQIEQRQQAQEQANQRSQQIAQIDSHYVRSLETLSREVPDALAANQYFAQILGAHFVARGANPAQLDELISNEQREITLAAYRQGKNPAQVILDLAKSVGWKPQPAPKDGDTNAAEQVERKKNALPASRSLTSTGGGAAGGDPTPSQIAEMSDTEFEAYYGGLSPAKQARLLGGG